MGNLNFDKPERRKISERAFEDLKDKQMNDNFTSEYRLENISLINDRLENERSREDSPFKARLTFRNHRDRIVKTGISRTEE